MDALGRLFLSALAAGLALGPLGPQGALGVSLRRASSPSVAPGVVPADWAPSASAAFRGDLNLNLHKATLMHSNLGGLGPDAGDESMIIKDVGIVGLKPVNLRISCEAGATYHGKPENNGIANGIITINLLSADKTKFNVQFVDDDGNPTRMSRFFLTVLDIDAGSVGGTGADPGKQKGIEIVGFSWYSDYYMLDQAKVKVGHDTKRDIWFGANLTGSGRDNPASAFNMSLEQKMKAVMVEFKDTAKIQMSLAVLAQSGPGGRNFMLAGTSDLLQAPFAPCRKPRFLDISKSRVLYNNLAGTVPGNGPRQIRYSSAGVIDGVGIDLWVEVLPGGNYTPAAPIKNGMHGKLGQINMGPVNTGTFLFMFKVAGTQQPIELSDFFFSFYDIDQTDDGYEALTVSSGSGTYMLSKDTKLRTIENGDGTVTFKSTAWGSEANNPRTVFAVQEDTAVTLYFDTALRSFEITYDTVAGAGGRNFQFGSMAKGACT